MTDDTEVSDVVTRLSDLRNEAAKALRVFIELKIAAVLSDGWPLCDFDEDRAIMKAVNAQAEYTLACQACVESEAGKNREK